MCEGRFHKLQALDYEEQGLLMRPQDGWMHVYA